MLRTVYTLLDYSAKSWKKMLADLQRKVSREFEDLEDDTIFSLRSYNQACAAGNLPANLSKNRYQFVLPYDHSRVKLQQIGDEAWSDYINASYISGEKSPRSYIATQGPTMSMRNDFWRMIWEYNCQAIAMLTGSKDDGIAECDHYWPYTAEPTVYGDVQVVMTGEAVRSDWKMRQFTLAKKGEPGRNIPYFHFTAWPDYSVPKRPQALISFIRTFREQVPSEAKPAVVHCSAGAGRTGTFTAVDRVLQQLKTRDTVDIRGMVAEMRQQRGWMVQSEKQYLFVHECRLCVLDKQEDKPEGQHPEERRPFGM